METHSSYVDCFPFDINTPLNSIVNRKNAPKSKSNIISGPSHHHFRYSPLQQSILYASKTQIIISIGILFLLLYQISHALDLGVRPLFNQIHDKINIETIPLPTPLTLENGDIIDFNRTLTIIQKTFRLYDCPHHKRIKNYRNESITDEIYEKKRLFDHEKAKQPFINENDRKRNEINIEYNNILAQNDDAIDSSDSYDNADDYNDDNDDSLVLDHDGSINQDDPLNKIVPTFKPGNNRHITTFDLGSSTFVSVGGASSIPNRSMFNSVHFIKGVTNP